MEQVRMILPGDIVGDAHRLRSASGSGTIGVSGSPATIATLQLAGGRKTLLPIQVVFNITGLDTAGGETFSITVNARLHDGTTVTLYSASGLTAGGNIVITSMDFSALPDGSRIVGVDVLMESSLTTTAATGSATIVALEV